MCEAKVAKIIQVLFQIFFNLGEISKMRELGPKNEFFINQSIKKPK